MEKQAVQEKKTPKIVKAFRIFDLMRELATILIYMGVLGFKIARGSGYFAVNVGLLALTGLYAVVFALWRMTNSEKKWGSRIKGGYKWAKLLFAVLGLGLTVYSIVTAVGEPSFFEVLAAALTGFTVFAKLVSMVLGLLVRRKIEKMKEERKKAAEARAEAKAAKLAEREQQKVAPKGETDEEDGREGRRSLADRLPFRKK